MEIKKIIFHQIIKEVNETPSLNLSESVIPITEDVKDFVSKLIKSFNQKYPTQGTFEEEKDLYPFQNYLLEFLEEEDTEDSFLEFSHRAMNILKDKINVHNATGGYVVFLYYKFRAQSFFITMMLDKSEQFTVDDDSLGIEKLMTLDLDKIARGNRVNLEKWGSEESLYLSFIKGTRTVSNYFIQFIGATDITSSKENLSKLHNSISNYLLSTNYSTLKKQKVKESIAGYLERCFRERKQVELRSVSSLISADEPLLFIDYLNANDIEVSDNIEIVKASDYKVFTGGSVKGDGYELHFDRKLVKDKSIVAKDGKIVISNVSDDIIRQINNG